MQRDAAFLFGHQNAGAGIGLAKLCRGGKSDDPAANDAEIVDHVSAGSARLTGCRASNLVVIFARAADDAGHVAAIIVLDLDECFVVGFEVCVVILDLDEIIVLQIGQFAFLADFVERHDFHLAGGSDDKILVIFLDGVAGGRGFAAAYFLLLEDGVADRAGNRVAVQIVELATAALANPLRASGSFD
jgi:hypothetical protein